MNIPIEEYSDSINKFDDASPIRYLNLPPIPDDIIATLSTDYSNYIPEFTFSNGNFIRSKSYSTEISNWCNKNICNLNWGFQLIKNELNVHIDQRNVKTKLIYIIDTGGNNVLTNFYDSQRNLVKSFHIAPKKWHLLKVDVLHNVTNLDPGRTRFSLSGAAFKSLF